MLTRLGDGLRRLRPVEGWFRRVAPDPRFRALDPWIRRQLGGKNALSQQDYDTLVGYFALGIAAYRSARCERVHYPGLPGTRGWSVEGVEGFARSGLLLAAWISTRGDGLGTPDGGRFDAADHLLRGLAAGSDPDSPAFWGWPVDYDQRIIEAGDIALIAWLLRDRLDAAARRNLARWLTAVLPCKVYGGNWHLAPLLAGLAAAALGAPPDPSLRERVRALQSLALEDGWYAENRAGRVDHYTAWQMQFGLPLAARMGEVVDAGWVNDRLVDFARGFAAFFTPNGGVPMFGRSLCYRFAVPAPLILAAAIAPEAVAPGLARRALDVVWAHFIAEGGLAHGTVTQGCGDRPTPELLENYLGRGSCLWSLRSLVAAYLQPPTSPFWTDPPLPLPVEQGSFAHHLAGPDLEVIGDGESLVVEVRHGRNRGLAEPRRQPMGLVRRLAQVVFRRPFRPDNYAVKYCRPRYRSDDRWV
ncbi:MAG: DUF2264 domain-containing protein [Elioraea sp.]|nr:DUF2264 domain-containing protein [Elioraea sp.]